MITDSQRKNQASKCDHMTIAQQQIVEKCLLGVSSISSDSVMYTFEKRDWQQHQKYTQ